MPLFQRKTGRVDATRFWVGDTRFSLQLDLDRQSLSGVAVGGLLDGLNRLGPAEDPDQALNGVYAYFSRGLEISAEEGFVTCYRVLFAASEGFQPFPGEVRLRGELLPLSAETTESDLVSLLGEPYWRDVDDEETLLFYEWGKVEWQIEMIDGRLSQWSLVTPPLMADPAHRAAYRVTAPPPEEGRPPDETGPRPVLRPKWARKR